MSKDCRADKKVATQIKFPDACAAGGRSDPAPSVRKENREIARTRFRSQVRVRREESG